jgi:YaiO family outer membrane protein
MKYLAATAALVLGLHASALQGQTQNPAELLNQEVILDQGTEVREEKPFTRWTIVPLYTFTAFNDGRAGWQQEYVEILYQPWRNLIVGTAIDIRQRPPSGTDILYSGLASWYPIPDLELHTKLSFCPDPQFSPDQTYSGGFEYQIAPRLLLLFDYTQYNFSSVAPIGPGSIEQIKPGVSWWFTDDIFFTFRYAHGWAFNDENYNYYSGTLNFWNMPGGGRLTAGLAYGTDPDIEFGSGDPSLSNAWIGSLFYQQPITDNFAIIAGVEYVYRMRGQSSSDQLYQQWSPTIGAVWKF